MKKLILILFAIISLCSCTDNGYLNSIPADSKALISVDMGKAAGINNKAVLKAFLHMKNVDESGLDLSHKVFMFSSSDGNLGLCAKVGNEDKLSKSFENLSQKGMCSSPKEFRDYMFTIVNEAWVVGYSDDAMLMMGPVEPASQAEMRAKIAKYLGQDEDRSIVSSPLYAKIDSIESPFAMVAAVEALPEKMSASLMLGAPKDADPSQVMVAAELKVKHHKLFINSEQFSFNKRIDKEIKKSNSVYRPIKGRYVPCMSSTDMLGMFVNVKGEDFLPLLQNDKAFQALLTGINTAIDMDNIIRSVDGDMTIKMPTFGEKSASMAMTAELAHAKWLADVDYWKQSCPSGSSITDWIKNGYHFQSADNSFYFAVSPDMQFYSGSNPEETVASLHASATPLSADLQEYIKGKKMVMLVNFNAFDSKAAKAVTSMLSPMFGNIETIVYSLK